MGAEEEKKEETGGYPVKPEEKKDVEAEEQDGDEEEETAEGGGLSANAKKSKNKKKRKQAAAAAAAAQAAEAGAAADANKLSGKGPQVGGTDEEFAAWLEEVVKAHPVPEVPDDEARKMPKNFIGCSFTGALRPAMVHPKFAAPPDAERPDYADHSEGVSKCERDNKSKDIPVLEGEELTIMRETCRLGREVLDLCSRALKPGVTGDFLDRVVYHACCERKIYPSPLNYFRFPKSVCVSPNEVICHGIPDMRLIEDGDIINLDISVYYKGFHSDLNETFIVGASVDEGKRRTVRAAYEALMAAASMIKPGTLYRDLGAAIASSASRNNCSVVSTYTGHGVGKLFHGPPNVPHYKKNKAVGVMKPGHVFTVEPMINLGGDGGDKMWPDNWTAVTVNGKPSAQFEQTFLVTETGVEVLTARLGAPTDCLPAYSEETFTRL